jgi:hypothetical protein
MVSTRTCFHCDDRPRLSSEEWKELWSREFLAEDDRPVRGGAVDLENILGKIDTDDDCLLHNYLPMVIAESTFTKQDDAARCGRIHSNGFAGDNFD